MKIKFDPIPKEKQLEAITKIYLYETMEIIKPFLKVEKIPKEYDWNEIKYKKFFDFKKEELDDYLESRIKICEDHYSASLDKRSLGAFLCKRDGKYKTGYVTRSVGIKYYSEYKNIYEATADYLLIKFGIIDF